MKVRYKIHGLDDLENMHLDANIRYSMLDIMLEGRRTINNMEKSRMLGSVVMPVAIRNIIEIIKMDKKTFLKDMIKMYNLQVEHPDNDTTVLELYISQDYFALGELLKQQFGRMGRRIIKVVDQQTIIDKLEEDLYKVYDKPFHGEIIDNDDKHLMVKV